ncbi:uncharacterized protein [Prorops nasuta]|uniref:uncharacterized protein n=1 Tax=Prorops nasuta TaxID=863751 RepID=UPI0034CE824C
MSNLLLALLNVMASFNLMWILLLINGEKSSFRINKDTAIPIQDANEAAVVPTTEKNAVTVPDDVLTSTTEALTTEDASNSENNDFEIPKEHRNILQKIKDALKKLGDAIKETIEEEKRSMVELWKSWNQTTKQLLKTGKQLGKTGHDYSTFLPKLHQKLMEKNYTPEDWE